MGKKAGKIVFAIIVALAVIIGVLYSMDSNILTTLGMKKPQSPKLEQGYSENENMKIVLSLEDEITDNSAWCGTFNLIWNDLKNEVAKQDIVFNPQPEVVNNLNKGTFNTSYLSEESYYKVYGTPSIELKNQIEKAIKEKFNENSDILNDFDWENHEPEDYFLYAMLKKEFEFPKVFTELRNGKFGNYENVKYFGIDSNTKAEVRNQVEVLYYNSDNDFAVKLLTKDNDEVIVAKGRNETTFGSMYEQIIKESENETEKNFLETDILQIPNISFKLKKEFKELENQKYKIASGDEYYIEKAMQTIQFDLDQKGGKVKSEAGMMTNKVTAVLPSNPRKFVIDNTFTIFLKEKDKELPYFATKISDITNVQNGATKIENNVSNNEQEYSKTIENVKLQLNIPNEWKYEEIPQNEEDSYKYALKLYKTNQEEYAMLYVYNNIFGVCGTGRTSAKITLNNGKEAEIGYYDGSKIWSDISFGIKNVAIINYGLQESEANEVKKFVKTVDIVEIY